MQKLLQIQCKLHLVLLLLTAVFSSCSKLPINKSERISCLTEPNFPEIKTENHDKGNTINYGIANNDSALYLKAIFHKEEDLMKIMHGGISIYFDPEGKKGKEYNLKIERGEKQAMQQPAQKLRTMPSRDEEKPI
ncbi:hypothetical protein OU798_21205 [Prolixibacteraceae bacterium Z1-6]|uniref:Lipoprotein n=1 Tax=Draconibacterium aestuarii TaxID=2998507 RepID=A0A9X3J9K4_9BACT|nr:hypothetical protein [Prolixibacteraceae bacterium Z1-6]